MNGILLSLSIHDDPGHESICNHDRFRITDKIRRLLELDFSSVSIEAEVGQLNHHRSGHVYLTFKILEDRIDAVIWRSSIQVDIKSSEKGC